MAKQSYFVTELVREWKHICSFGSNKTYLEETLGKLNFAENLQPLVPDWKIYTRKKEEQPEFAALYYNAFLVKGPYNDLSVVKSDLENITEYVIGENLPSRLVRNSEAIGGISSGAALSTAFGAGVYALLSQYQFSLENLDLAQRLAVGIAAMGSSAMIAGLIIAPASLLTAKAGKALAKRYIRQKLSPEADNYSSGLYAKLDFSKERVEEIRRKLGNIRKSSVLEDFSFITST